MSIIAAADGSALGNPGPAGWAWYVDEQCWASGGWPHGTNNMGELTAVLDLLRQTAHLEEELTIVCDSTYAINSITKWMPNWKRKGWRKGDGQPVQNLEIMQALDRQMQGRKVRFEWVKGHTGHELNEAADRLANAAALAFKEGRQPDPGPGMAAALDRVPAAQPARHVPEPEPELDLFSLSELDRAEMDLGDLDLTDEERVIAAERSLLTDEVRGDPAAVAALLHPDWSEIGRSGRLWSREELLAEIAPLASPTALDVVSVERVGAEVILLVWRALAESGTTLRSSWWVRRGDGWVQRFHQGTPEA